MTTKQFKKYAENYIARISDCLTNEVIEGTYELARTLLSAWEDGNTVYICGNGGSAANAMHLANDLHYGAGACGKGKAMHGIRVEALPSNTGVVTCLANDTGFENIYSHQIAGKGRKNDVLIALSGSGNSENIINALRAAKDLGMKTFAILAFDGGKSKDIAEKTIHVKVSDMQIAEDTQLMIGHMCMQWLTENKPNR